MPDVCLDHRQPFPPPCLRPRRTERALPGQKQSRSTIQTCVFVAEPSFFDPRGRLLQKRQGQVELAGGLIGRRQVGRHAERERMVRVEFGPGQLHVFLHERQRQVEFSGVSIARGQVVNAYHCVNMVGSRAWPYGA